MLNLGADNSGPVRQFLAGGLAYNATALALGLLGIAAGIVALWIAVVQLRKIRSAAQAARDAALGARRQLSAVSAISNFSELCAISRELLMHLRDGHADSAALRAIDLRGGLARARVAFRDLRGPTQKDWQTMIAGVVSVHEALHQPDSDGSMQRACQNGVAIISKVYDNLNTFVSTAALRAGEE